MRSLVFAAILGLTHLFPSVKLLAQESGPGYKTALGVKFFPGAVSLKHFNSNRGALEGLAYLYNDGFRFTGLYEFHSSIPSARGLSWYVGPGAHFAVWNNSWRGRHPGPNGPEHVSIGIDGVLGLDYKFSGAPINMSLDWQPSVNLIGHQGYEFGWGGLAIRYTF